MSVHPHESDLHRHFDGELTARESWEIEAHLQECPDCAAAYDELGRLVDRVAELPESIEPPVDLWAGIATRIATGEDELSTRRERRDWRRRNLRSGVLVGWLAAVAAALVLGVGLGRIFPGEAGQPLATGADAGAQADLANASDSVVPGAVLASYEEPAYDQAVAELEAVLAGMRDQLEPETIAVIEENLAIIDHAIEEARAALLADPANQQLHGHLNNTMQKKLRMLRMVTGAAI